MLHERRQLLSAVHDVAGIGAGRLDVAGLPSMIATHLVDVIGAFRSRHPGIEVTLTGAADTAELESLVSSARCDIGIADLPVRRAGLRTVSLGSQDLMAVFPPGSVLPDPGADGVPVVSEVELRSWPLVVLPASTSSRALVDEVFAGSSAGPRVSVTSDLRDMLVPLVLRGAGAALVPDRIAADAAAQGAVVARVRPRVRREVGLVLREGAHAPAVGAFIDLVLEVESSRPRAVRRGQPAAAPVSATRPAAGASSAKRSTRAASSSARRR
jgi:LysR family transcriptional regulator, carnitine catabolism transcriptional activator